MPLPPNSAILEDSEMVLQDTEIVGSVLAHHDDGYKQHHGERKVKFIKRQLILALVTLSLLTGCESLGDLGKGLGDLFKGFTVRFP